jgi:hypothetical protein
MLGLPLIGREFERKMFSLNTHSATGSEKWPPVGQFLIGGDNHGSRTTGNNSHLPAGRGQEAHELQMQYWQRANKGWQE